MNIQPWLTDSDEWLGEDEDIILSSEDETTLLTYDNNTDNKVTLTLLNTPKPLWKRIKHVMAIPCCCI